MVNIDKWKIYLSLLLVVAGLFYAAPNLMQPAQRDWLAAHLPSWAPHKTVNLGLDLRGGSHLLLEVDTAAVIRERLEMMADSARSDLRRAGVLFSGMATQPDGLTFTLANPEKDRAAAYKIARALNDTADVEIENGVVRVLLGERGMAAMQTHLINQSIEIVRRRIDETGTKEPLIQRQGDQRIVLQLPGLEDPEEVKRLLGRTAKMTFHLLDEDALVTGNIGPSSRRLPVQGEPGNFLVIRKQVRVSGEQLIDSQASFDQNGQPVVSFRFDSLGAKRFCEVSRENVNKRFATVLDNVIITAPNINEPICGGSGQISGNFSVKEAADLALLLRSGALPAPLNVVEERSVGPTLGSDSVAAGKIAAVVAFALVFAWMVLSYGLFGLFASIALTLNLILIFAVLSLLQATLTMPGIAGIVLTIGIAVDANVLIYERIREELRQGRSVISSIDTGYRLAWNTIIDSNLTTLIVAIILFSFGTGPVKGFAVSMCIGIVTSMFSAILLTRLMVVTWLRRARPSTLTL